MVDQAGEDRRYDPIWCPDLKTKLRLFNPVEASKGYVAWGCGYITCEDIQATSVTNNVTELVAILIGAAFAPEGRNIMLYSDSKISLGTVFCDFKLEGLPDCVLEQLAEFKRETHFRFNNHGYTQAGPIGLLDGHPNDTDLAMKKGHRGLPTSVHNRWCDYMCNIRKPDLAEWHNALRKNDPRS